MNRKQRRAAKSKSKKSGNKEIEEKIKLLSKLKDKCFVCKSELDMSNIEMLSEWMVVVREEEGRVNLYCPPCWESAKNAIEVINELQQANMKKD